MIRKTLCLVLGALLLALLPAAVEAQKKQLVVALNQDPDILDPTLSRTYVGRIVFAQICEKLYEIDEKLNIFPQLAAALPAVSDGGKTVTIKLRPGVKFNDGTPMNAEAVRFSLDRHQRMKGSNRRSELASIASIEALDPLTVQLRLKAPFAPLAAQLADRAGMPVSPAAAQKLGDKFGTAPVCVGPWRFVERVAQDRIVVERSPHYFDPAAAAFDRIVFRIIPDDNVRLANLRSGDIDVMHRVTPSDTASLKKEGRFDVASVTGLGFNSITINLRNKTGKTNPPGDLGTPLANDPRVREALELSIDRAALNQVVFAGAFTPGNQAFPPGNRFYAQSVPIPQRDIAKAKALVKESGVASPTLTILVPSDNERQLAAQVVQSMAKEAGIEIRIQSVELISMLAQQRQGNFEASFYGWSGRVDPDGNLHYLLTCKAPTNDPRYCNPELDALLNEARTKNDTAERKALYDKALAIINRDRPMVVLYHQPWIFALAARLNGFTTYPDGIIRLANVKFKS